MDINDIINIINLLWYIVIDTPLFTFLFRFVAKPYIASVTPSSGSLNGGNLVTISGDGFKDSQVTSISVGVYIPALG